jgi:hypothetical protein
MINKCKICGRRCEGSYCFQHKPRKPLRANKKINTPVSNMREFFMEIWSKRQHVSEVSGERISSPPSSAYFHHILPKNKYPQAALDEENIILLTIDEHTNVENNMYRYEEINNRREHMKEKYN